MSPFSPKTSKPEGLTLIELIVVIVIIAILATIAVPGFGEMIKNNRVSSQNNELVSIITFARSEAIRRSTDVTIAIDPTSDGWVAMVFVGPDDTGPTLRETSNARVSLTNSAEGNLVTFNSRGYIKRANDLDGTFFDSETVSIRLEHVGCNGSRQARLMELLPTGQISSKSEGCKL